MRSARPEDATRIAEIYNQGIEDRVATFETQPRDAAHVAAWFDDELPFIVAERDGEVVGFARVSPYSDRCVYEGVGDHGVYVAREARGSGVGRDLLETLAFAAASVRLYKLTARILADNEASLAVHRAAGFREVGVQRRHGKLDGEWKDVVIVELLLGEAAEA